MTPWSPWDDSITWRIPLFDTVSGIDADSGTGRPSFDPPEAWARALAAVALDLRCLRHGRSVNLDRLVWDLSINGDYHVSVGWQRIRGLGGFGIGGGLTVDASYGEAAAWVAEVVQDDLAGYEFVQWPSRGRHLLHPRLHGADPVWVDPHGDVVLCPIGHLCENAGSWR